MSEREAMRRLVLTLVAEGTLAPEAATILIRRMGEATASTPAPSSRAVAVVGVAGRVAGAADLESYWRLIEAGEEALVEMPARRWPHVKGARRKGGFLPDEDRFDPLFFRISPTEAAMMDPQQRIFLETAYHAIEDAGFAPTSLSGARCGVFVGAGAGDYAQRFREAGLQSSPLGLMGNVASILAARISYFLDLKGPSVALDTACSSSLVALHLACESLHSGACDMALAGGVAVISTEQFIDAMLEGGMLSPSDRCASFDARADGFVCGEGAGAVLLKRLDDALRDGDFIHGVIRATGINQDGRTNGVTAPSAPAQAALEAEVYARAGVDPRSISYVETHGTGTPLGDPIEIEALTSAFRKSTDAVGFCALGAVKANIGHALTAAGIAGLLKLLLMLRHRRIPPLAGFGAVNPRIDLAASPFYAPTAAADWVCDGPRRAAISSFGFSGTNAHAVVEEAPARAPRAAAEGPFCFPFSARSPEALRRRLEDLLAALPSAGAPGDIAFTLAVGRDHHPHRAALVAEDAPGLERLLRAALAGERRPDIFRGEARPEGAGALAALAARMLRSNPEEADAATLAELYCCGVEIAWRELPGAVNCRRIPLPAYPFEREAYGIAPPPGGAQPQGGQVSGLQVSGFPRADPPAFHAARDPEAVMAGLVPAIHAEPKRSERRAPAIAGFHSVPGVAGASASRRISETPRPAGVDGRDKPGHDDAGARRSFDFGGSMGEGAAPDLDRSCSDDQFIALRAALARQAAPAQGEAARAFRSVEAFGRRVLAAAYGEMGLFAKPAHTPAGLRKALRIIPAKQRLHEALLDILLRDGALRREGDLLRPDPAFQAPRDLAAERARILRDAPELAPFLTLLETCVAGLPKLLAGAITATEVLFPGGRMDLVEPIYRGHPLAEHFNRLLAEAVAHLTQGRAGARIIEIGAGTGGATVGIVEALRGQGVAAEYCYTDVSLGFVEHGRRRFAAEGLRFAAFDIEKPPAAQGFSRGFDIVVASNVLHATRDIGTTLAHVAQLLAPGGALLLNEVTALQDFATMTFGLTDGWWAFEDAENRIANAPLLDVAGWREALAAAGFESVDAFGLPGEAEDRFSQSVIVAHLSSGVRKSEAEGSRSAPATGPRAFRLASSAADRVEEIVTREIAAALSLPPERIDPRGRFMDYGVDSILGVRVVTRLNEALGLDLRPTVLFDHPTVRDLAEHLRREHELRPSDVAAESPPPSPSPASREREAAGVSRAFDDAPNLPPLPRGGGGMGRGPRDERIAVIGLAARFADCPSLEAFHAMLREGRSGVTTVPTDRWSADPASLPEALRAQAAFLLKGGFLTDAGDFDPLFFRMSGREAELTDPQHRVFLIEAWRALEHAGYGERELDGQRCGVFVGAHGGDYTHRMTEVGVAPEAFAFMGNAASILAARIAYVLNLKGPCLSVDTACSSSLTAIHLACRSLIAGECDMALAGGVFINTTMGFNVAAAKAGMLSPVGACKTFDADADGFVPGEGAGVVVLKPYAQALADGDHIEAVILASAMNQDGRTNGITAPSPASQAALEREVYEKAGVSPRDIGYVEAHGTGTPLGDPIEIEGLTSAFRDWTADKGFCAIGSVKTNIGHAAHAAGVAGLLKLVLSLRHRELFPSLNFSRENPQLRLAETPFVVNTALRPWESAGPRLGAVSAFGFSGTNVHILLREAEPVAPLRRTAAPCLVPLSARTPEALARRRRDLSEWLAANEPALADVARTLIAGRAHFEHRWAAVVSSIAELRAALEDRRPGDLVDATDGRASTLVSAAQAYLCGGEIAADVAPAGARRIALPSYPFELRRYWLDAPEAAAAAPRDMGTLSYRAPIWEERSAGAGKRPRSLWLIAEATRAAAELQQALEREGLAVRRFGFAEVERFGAGAAPEAVAVLLEPGAAASWPGSSRPSTPTRRGASEDRRDVEVPLTSDGFCRHAAGRQSSSVDDGHAPLISHLPGVDGRDEPGHDGGWGREPIADLSPPEPGPVVALLQRFFALPIPLLVIHCGHPGEECLAALRRSARFDGAQVDLRLLRVDDDLPADALAQALLAECAREEGETEAALIDGRRLARRMAPVAAPAGAPFALRRGAHILVTGGGGALGALFARRLAAEWGARLTLLGRSAPSEAVRALPNAHYLHADVTDERSLARALVEARAAHGPIHGVLHLAGAPSGALLREATRADFSACLAPKTVGTLLLDRLLAEDPLDFFVIFSSLAGELGDFGQGSYALANSFCDRFAAWRAARGGRGVTRSLGWPLWREGRGVLSAEGERIYLATAGMPYLESEQGWRAFLDALALPHPQLAVLPIAAEAAEALFAPTHRAPAPPRVAEPPRSASAAPACDLRDAVRRHLTAIVAELMKIEASRIAGSVGLADYGFDSIALKTFAARIGADYGVTLSPAVFFSRGTIDALADHLIETEPDAVAARHGGATPEPEPQRVAAAPAAPSRAPIAVIGMSGRFPGSPDLRAFWRNLEAGVDLVGPLPEGRRLAGGDGARIIGGFLEEVDRFDAAFFKISPREACFLDPQHRLAIEEVWRCAEDAGVRMSALEGRAVGVFFGQQVNEYGALAQDRDAARAQVALGNIATMLPNRISYLFDLRGPSEAIDTACSSSLVAVHRAARALQDGECEMAFAGGVSLILSAEGVVSTAELGVLSKQGRCRSFDAAADGYVKGEGVGVLLLKPLAQAQADGDPIHGVILGSAENHGGRGHSLTAPNGTAQTALIASALRRAGVSSDTIGYVEAHCTATELGDPVEVLALKDAFARTCGDGAAPRCGLGTVKTNIGHLEPASGIAGLIKTVLALEHGRLPATLHFETLNPLIELSRSPFFVVDRAQPWPALADPSGRTPPRRAGVSSFGLGGSNAHVVLEEAGPRPAPAPQDRAELLAVSARDRDALAAMLRRLAAAVSSCAVADVAHTLAVGREAMEARAALRLAPGQSLAETFAAAAEAVAEGREREGLWIGRVARSGRETPAETDRFMADLLAAGQLARIAALWVGGATLPEGITRGRRISLPGYPFAGPRFWCDRALERPARAAGAAAPPPSPSPAAREREAAGVTRASDEAPTLPPLPRSGGGMGRGLEPPHSPRSESDVLATVRRHLAQALYLEESQLDVSAPFAELGLDSILAVELAKSLNDVLGTRLQAARLYDHANISGLAAHLHALLAPCADVGEVSPECAFLIERLESFGKGRLTPRARLDEIAVTPAEAESVLGAIATRFGVTLSEAEIGRCVDLHAVGALIAERVAAASPPPSPSPAAREREAAGVTRAFDDGPTLPPLPRSGGGLERGLEGMVRGLEPPPPSSPDVLAIVRRHLAQALYLAESEIDDCAPFSELGLDSILAVELAKSLNDALGTRLQASRLYDHADVAGLAAHLEALLAAPSAEIGEVSPECAFLIERLESLGKGRLTPRARLDEIAVAPAEAEAVLGAIAARFGVALTAAEIGRCVDLHAVGALIAERAGAAAPPPSPSPASREREASGVTRAFDDAPTLPSGAHDPLVAIRIGGAGRPSFWAHGGTGDVNWVGEIARALPETEPVYGLEAAGLDGTSAPLAGLEAMAAHYVAAIRRAQPEGPYRLGGYSAGGAIAFEMARQLAAAGERVERLALLDPPAPGRPGIEEMQAGFGPGYVYLVVANWLGSRWGMRAPLALADLDGLDKTAMLDLVVAHLYAHASPSLPAAELRRQIEIFDAVGRAVGDALRAYRPEPLTAPMEVILFECRDGMAGGANPLGLPDTAVARDYREGWETLLASPIRRVALPCDHFGVLRPEPLRRIREALAAPAAAGDPVEATVLALVREVLPDVPPEAVTPERSMSELGANSMDRVEVATRAMESLGIVAPHSELLGLATIGALIDVLRRHLPHG
jgi:acyl transferase domain-containing protein/thioesterase domain-containing protein/acyl carrier protein